MCSSDVIKCLQNLREKNYFSDSAWDERGLIPSPPELKIKLENTKKSLIDELISLLEKSASRDTLYEKALQYLEQCLDDEKLDTEESEFLSDCICEVAVTAQIERFIEDSEAWILSRYLRQ